MPLRTADPARSGHLEVVVARGRVVVVGLGPGGPDLVTTGTAERIGGSAVRFLRTSRHPAASLLPDAPSFDHLYDALDSFDAVYREIVERLVESAGVHGEVLYAVPGSPLVAEHTVELLCADPRVDVEIVPALSFLDLTWARLRVDPLTSGVCIVDGHRFAEEAAGSSGAMLVAQCHSREILSDIKLSVDTDLVDAPEVTVLQRLGLPDERIVTVAWDDLDRVVEPDHLTSLWIDGLEVPLAAEIVRLEETMRTLRAGCPWDAEQTHGSLARYVVEEAYELVEAIDAVVAAETERLESDSVDPVDHLAEELGDVVFQVVFHSCLAAEQGWFTLADVLRVLREKLVRRHPHVFPRADFDTEHGDTAVTSADDVVRNWEQIKRDERGRAADPFDAIPATLPALGYASKVIKVAAQSGADVPAVPGVADDADALGEHLLRVVAAARAAGIDPETTLRLAAARLREQARRDA